MQKNKKSSLECMKTWTTNDYGVQYRGLWVPWRSQAQVIDAPLVLGHHKAVTVSQIKYLKKRSPSSQWKRRRAPSFCKYVRANSKIDSIGSKVWPRPLRGGLRLRLFWCLRLGRLKRTQRRLIRLCSCSQTSLSPSLWWWCRGLILVSLVIFYNLHKIFDLHH